MKELSYHFVTQYEIAPTSGKATGKRQVTVSLDLPKVPLRSNSDCLGDTSSKEEQLVERKELP